MATHQLHQKNICRETSNEVKASHRNAPPPPRLHLLGGLLPSGLHHRPPHRAPPANATSRLAEDNVEVMKSIWRVCLFFPQLVQNFSISLILLIVHLGFIGHLHDFSSSFQQLFISSSTFSDGLPPPPRRPQRSCQKGSVFWNEDIYVGFNINQAPSVASWK